MLAREKEVEDSAKSEDIRALIDGGAPPRQLLGRHVAWRPHDCTCHGVLADRLSAVRGRCLDHLTAQLRHAPIEHEHLTERTEHDVLRLEIAVDDASCMRESDGVAHLTEHAKELRTRARTADEGIEALA